MLTCTYILPVHLWWLMMKNLPVMQETWVWSLDWEDPLEKGMATHSSILGGRIPWTEEPGGLQSMGSKGVRHDWASNIFTFTFACSPNTYYAPDSVFLEHTDVLRKCLPEDWGQWASLVAQTVKESACHAGGLGLIPGLGKSPRGGHGNLLQYSCLENPYGQRSLAGYSPWGRKELDMTE